MSKDRCTALISIATGVVVAFLASQLPKSVMPNDLGPSVFPYLTAGILIICGILLFIKGKEPAKQPFLTKTQKKRFIEILILEGIYIAGMYLFGFIVPSVIILVIVSKRFAAGKNIAFWHFGLFAVGFTGALYCLFTYILNMRLPVGILF